MDHVKDPSLDQSSARAKLLDSRHAEKLELENKTLRAVLDSMPDNISIKDLEGVTFSTTPHTAVSSAPRIRRR